MVNLERLNIVDDDRRIFEGIATVEMADNVNVVVPIDEVEEFMDTYLARGGNITEEHTNRIIGKTLEYWRTEIEVTPAVIQRAVEVNPANASVRDVLSRYEGQVLPAIGVRAQIHKDYAYDDEIWDRIKDQSRPDAIKGLSFGGRSAPVRYDNDHKGIVHTVRAMWELAVTTAPRVSLAILSGVNELAQNDDSTDTLNKPRKEGENTVEDDKPEIQEQAQSQDAEENKSEERSESPQSATVDALSAEIADLKTRFARIEELLAPKQEMLPDEQAQATAADPENPAASPGEVPPGEDAPAKEGDAPDAVPEDAPAPSDEAAPAKDEAKEPAQDAPPEEDKKPSKDDEVAQSDKKTRVIDVDARPESEIKQALAGETPKYDAVKIASGEQKVSYSELRGIKK